MAHAQQLKNKDIPEGGAKGVILAHPESDSDRVGQAFADALLDMIVPRTGNEPLSIDYYHQDELLYLGPDENISNTLITWIVDRARHRGHPIPEAFMSSKPGAGINHKLYGVTSEGVTVFLETALRACGINPREQDFSVKITGGPDGDVAGIVSSALASRMVYREGLDWFEQMPDHAIADLGIQYLRARHIVQHLIRQVQGSNLPDRKRIVELLDDVGATALLRKNPMGHRSHGSLIPKKA